VINKDRPKWFGHVEHKGDADRIKCCTPTVVDGTRQKMFGAPTALACTGAAVGKCLGKTKVEAAFFQCFDTVGWVTGRASGL